MDAVEIVRMRQDYERLARQARDGEIVAAWHQGRISTVIASDHLGQNVVTVAIQLASAGVGLVMAEAEQMGLPAPIVSQPAEPVEVGNDEPVQPAHPVPGA
jgi:hypothetical protein